MLSNDERMDIVVAVISNHFNVIPTTMFCKSRVEEIVKTRQLFHCISHYYLNISLHAVGRYSLKYGWRIDHSTVLHNKNAILDLAQIYRDLATTLLELVETVRTNIEIAKNINRQPFLRVV